MHRLLPLSLALLFASSLFAQQQPQLSLSIDADDRLSPAGLADVRFHVENNSDQDATNVLLDMFLGNGAVAAALTPSDPATECSSQNIGHDRVGCHIPLLAAHATSDVTITAHFDAGHYGFRFFVSPKTVTRDATFYREYPVTADGGAGSFRQAILDTNAECSSVPCRIDFEISEPIPAAGWFTIAPSSPLPRVLAPEIAIDGERQTAITGDTNPRGPEIFLDGRGVNVADGLIAVWLSAAFPPTAFSSCTR